MEMEKAQINPAPRAVNDLAENGDEAERKEHGQKKRQSQSLKMAVIKAHAAQHRHKAEGTPDHLALVIRPEADAVLHAHAAGRVEVADAHPEQQKHGRQQAPINMGQ